MIKKSMIPSLMEMRFNRTNITCYNSINTPCNHTERYSIPLYAVIAFLVAVFVVGLVGNTIVVLLILSKRKLRTFTNILILNLAFADLLVTLFCVPLEIPLEINHKWIYGKVFCQLFYPIQSATVYGSVFTLVVLSFSRYWAILHPYRKQPRKSAAKIAIVFIWITAFLLVLPYSLGLEYDSNDGKCNEVWITSHRKIFTLATFLLQYIIPLAIISIAYSCIMYEMTVKKRSSSEIYTDKKRQDESRKLIKLFLTITITFSICGLPYHMIAFSYDFADANSFEYIEDLSIASYLCLYLNSALNPIIYTTYSSNFRGVFNETCNSWRKYFSKYASNGRSIIVNVSRIKNSCDDKEYLNNMVNLHKMKETMA